MDFTVCQRTETKFSGASIVLTLTLRALCASTATTVLVITKTNNNINCSLKEATSMQEIFDVLGELHMSRFTVLTLMRRRKT